MAQVKMLHRYQRRVPVSRVHQFPALARVQVRRTPSRIFKFADTGSSSSLFTVRGTGAVDGVPLLVTSSPPC